MTPPGAYIHIAPTYSRVNGEHELSTPWIEWCNIYGIMALQELNLSRQDEIESLILQQQHQRNWRAPAYKWVEGETVFDFVKEILCDGTAGSPSPEQIIDNISATLNSSESIWGIFPAYHEPLRNGPRKGALVTTDRRAIFFDFGKEPMFSAFGFGKTWDLTIIEYPWSSIWKVRMAGMDYSESQPQPRFPWEQFESQASITLPYFSRNRWDQTVFNDHSQPEDAKIAIYKQKLRKSKHVLRDGPLRLVAKDLIRHLREKNTWREFTKIEKYFQRRTTSNPWTGIESVSALIFFYSGPTVPPVNSVIVQERNYNGWVPHFHDNRNKTYTHSIRTGYKRETTYEDENLGVFWKKPFSFTRTSDYFLSQFMDIFNLIWEHQGILCHEYHDGKHHDDWEEEKLVADKIRADEEQAKLDEELQRQIQWFILKDRTPQHIKATECIETFIRAMSWQEFELLIARLLALQGWETKLTQSGADEGVDFIARKDSFKNGKQMIYGQAKHFSADNSVGAPVVRNIMGAAAKDKDGLGLVATSSTFTKQALEEEKQYNRRLGLWDIDHIINLINGLNKTQFQNLTINNGVIKVQQEHEEIFGDVLFKNAHDAAFEMIEENTP